MCGIWGWWHRNGRPAPDEKTIRQATEIMEKRGPDDFGLYRSQAGFAMGFRRLSIIDLATGHQPVSNEDGAIQVTLNGEIYNFKSLRERLIGLGHVFKSYSDTEVIAHGYEQWGEQVFGHLCGMFGIAIWDESKQKLIIARDRLGIKPVYFTNNRDGFGYASDPRSMKNMPDVDLSIDEQSLALYLYYGNVPAPWSVFSGIRKLRPAEMCIVDSNGARIKKYWHNIFQPEPRADAVCLNQFTDLFEKVVGEHLISDVPLGAFLSGGMDSTCVVQTATKMLDRPIMTFNVVFSDPNANEEIWANEAAEVLETNHHRLAMEEDPNDIISETLSNFPEPFGDTAAIPNSLLSKLIRKHCTVALSGDGGDEVFGGYGLRTAQAITYLRRFPRAVQKMAAYLPGIGSLSAQSLQDISTFYAGCRARLSIEQIEHIMDADSKPRKAIESHIEMMRDELRRSNARGPINPSLFLDQSFGLPDQMLTKVDITSMSHSLEVRVPMLDHRVVEFAAALPEKMKQKGFAKDNTKMIIRHYLRRKFPESFISRPKKGFGMPLERSFFLKISLKDELLSKLPELISMESFKGFMKNQSLNTNTLWNLYALSVWCKQVSHSEGKTL